MSLVTHKRDWEAMAEIDPLWAILTDEGKRGGGWTPDEFFAEGEREVAAMLDAAKRAGGPIAGSRALDFGCGAGRLTRALGERFEHCVGVDISARMVGLARELNADRDALSFKVNAEPDLALFESDSFDLVYSSLVLQHQPSTDVVGGYLREFVRVTRQGGLVVFQLPSHMALPYRLQSKRRAYSALRRLGFSDRFLVERARLTPMRMLAVPIDDVCSAVAGAGGSVLTVEADDPAATRYFVRA